MLHKDSLINNLHKDYREDNWVNEIFTSAGLSLDEVENTLSYLERQYWFDTIDLEFLPIYEKSLGIKTNPNNTIDDRRSYIEAKWKSDGKCNLSLIQSVCNSWKNGDAIVNFIDGAIQLKFIGENGVPKDLATLIKAIEDVKPEHINLTYIFAYLLIKDIHNKTKISELETKKISEFAFNSR